MCACMPSGLSSRSRPTHAQPISQLMTTVRDPENLLGGGNNIWP